MGWYFSPQSRYELIAELIAPQETERASVKVIAHALRGNVLWSIAEVTAKVEGVHRHLAPGQSLRYIRCDLLERSGDQGGAALLCVDHAFPERESGGIGGLFGNLDPKVYECPREFSLDREKPGLFVHYDWHYFWEYGNGEIGNQGVHEMDIAVWGHNRGLPNKVFSAGGRFLDDDGQTPNTQATTFSYPDGSILTFEVRNLGSFPEGGTEDCANSAFGTEFDALREYVIGDDVRSIDWRASARRSGCPATRSATRAPMTLIWQSGWGERSGVRELERRVTARMDFPSALGVTGQTYTRKLDAWVLAVVSGIASSAGKFTSRIRRSTRVSSRN